MIKRLVIIFGLLLFLIGCVPKEAPYPMPTAPGPVIAQDLKKDKTKVSWKKKWEGTLKAAKKEGRVVAYVSSLAPSMREAAVLIKQKHGFDLEIISGSGSELKGRLLNERRNGLFIPDIFISGLDTIYGMVKKSDAADTLNPALILPEVRNPKGWYGGQLNWADEDHKVYSFLYGPKPLVGINSEMVSPRDLQSYHDLLNPKWKGKIIINDPTIAGPAFSSFSSLLYNKVLDLDFFRQLVSQQAIMLTTSRLLVDWLAQGGYSIAIFPHETPMEEYQNARDPVIEWANMKEGSEISSEGGNLVLVNKAPHPNAARIFINWLLSREGQTIVQKFEQQQSARVDIPTDMLNSLRVRQPGGKYFLAANTKEKWVEEEQDKYLELAKQVFDPFLK